MTSSDQASLDEWREDDGLVRAARALLHWPIEKLASISGVSVATIRRIESEDIKRPRRSSYLAVRNALEAGGVVFLWSAGGNVAVAKA